MAAEVMLVPERRFVNGGYGFIAPPPPAPESLLGRLDQIDLRLRQLEEQRRSSSPSAEVIDHDVSSVASGDGRQRARHHRHSKSMPPALQEQQQHLIKGTLMDRLNLLESRIRQLSCELDGSAAGGSASVVAAPPPPPMSWPAEVDRSGAWPESPMADPPPHPAAAMTREVRMAGRQIHRSKPDATTKAEAAKEKKKKKKRVKEARCGCEEEKRKAEQRSRGSAGRRWFAVGC